MQRADHSTRAIDGNGPGKDGYTEGVPGVTPATVLTAKSMNAIQEELSRTIEAHAVTLHSADDSQLADVLQSRAEITAAANMSNASGFPSTVVTGIASNGLGRIVVVGSSPGTITTSDDSGLTWTSQTSPGGGSYGGVIWAADHSIFVAVATNSIQTSTDGITWTERYTTNPLPLHTVAYGNGVFVVAAGDATSYGVVTSTDGISWTFHSVTQKLSSILLAFGAGRFVSPQDYGSTVPHSSVYSSTDGVTWTASTWGGSVDIMCTGLGYSAKGFFAAHGTLFGTGGTPPPITTDGNGGPRSLQISTDGVTWTEVHHGPGEAGGLLVTDVGAYSTTYSRTETDWAYVGGTAVSAQDFKASKVFSPMKWIRYAGRSCVILGRGGNLSRSSVVIGPV